MSEVLAPCIAVVGPANSGKTTLLHLLDRALQRHPAGLMAYVVKGSPDGSGRYQFHNPEQRERLKSEVKGKWAGNATIEQIVVWTRHCRQHLDLALLDFGGKHDPANELILRECTHYIALSRTFDDSASEAQQGIESWTGEADSVGLTPLAILTSRWKTEEVSVDASGPVIRGVFRGDAGRPEDTLNDPLIDALVKRLISLPMPGRQPSYINLNIGRWNPAKPAPDLSPLRERIRFLARSRAVVAFGGPAPIFAYLLAMHAALDTNPQTDIMVADPKTPQFLVDIPARCLSEPDAVSPFFEAEPVLDGSHRWRFHHKTTDQFLPFSVTGNLAFAPPIPPAVASADKVTVWGLRPIILNCVYSRWLRGGGASEIAVWDASSGLDVRVF